MQRKPLGVWFSLALGLFLAALLVGFVAGKRIAPYWVRHQIRKESPLPPAAQLHLEQELTELEALSIGDCADELISQTAEARRTISTSPVTAMESTVRSGRVPAFEPVAQYELAFARLHLAAEYRGVGNSDDAGREFAEAQNILRSIGWRDVSSETLEQAASRRLCHAPEIAAQGAVAK